MLFATWQSTRGISEMEPKCAEVWLHFPTLSLCFPWLPRVQRSLSHESLDLQLAWRSQCLARDTLKPQLGERRIYNSSCSYAPAQNSLTAERLPPLNLGLSTHRVETEMLCLRARLRTLNGMILSCQPRTRLLRHGQVLHFLWISPWSSMGTRKYKE